MPTETIVAVFDTDAHAENAIADLKAAGIPSSAVQHYAKDDYPTSTDNIGGVSESRPQGFWAWLTGEDEDTEYHSVYDRSIESGGTVVTVIVDDQDSARIVSLLEAHSPSTSRSAALCTATGPVRHLRKAPRPALAWL